MKIKVKLRPRFGILYYYPACELSEMLLKFARRRMFKEVDLRRFISAGFEIIYTDK